ncbi:hypothetical protein NDU88_001943 [Pleurodeles waltl]|uniref:Uncharacterized protein n=1 Tax=Pleurodeles waltl TaxID=8319 RepID=A0AAV7U891_PLEWA|nr:hypothetical protein NDU88_001943 [Pleurodeles waltl]
MAKLVGIRHTLERDLRQGEVALATLDRALSDISGSLGEWERQRHRLCELWDQLDKHVGATSHHGLYMEGDKTGRLLARLIRSETLIQSVLVLKDHESGIATTWQVIGSLSMMPMDLLDLIK